MKECELEIYSQGEEEGRRQVLEYLRQHNNVSRGLLIYERDLEPLERAIENTEGRRNDICFV